MMAPLMNHRVTTVCAIALAFVLLSCSNEVTSTNRHPVPKPVAGDGIADTGEAEKGPTGGESSAVFGETDAASGSDLADILGLTEKKSGYSSKGKIDPFKSLYAEKENKDPGFADPKGKEKPALSPVNDCGVTPLTQVGLEQLNLVAILKGVSGDYALVEDASGKGYVLKDRVCIGIHSGRVAKIQSDTVIIQERFQDLEFVDGEWRPAGILTRELELTFPRRNGV